MKSLPPPRAEPSLSAFSADPWGAPRDAPPPPKGKRGRGRPIKDPFRKGADPPKNKRQNRHEPSPETRAMIANMASYGLDLRMICKIAGIDASTLYRHYRQEMQISAAEKDLTVMQTGYLKAIGGPEKNWEKADPAMIRWWVACRQRWAPPGAKDYDGGGAPDLSRLTDEQLDELEALYEAAALDDRSNSQGEGGEAE